MGMLLGGHLPQASAAGGGEVFLQDGPLLSVEPESESVEVYAGIRFMSDGKVYFPQHTGAGAGDWDWVEAYTWETIPGDYWVRCTLNSGTLFAQLGHEFDSGHSLSDEDTSVGIWITLNSAFVDPIQWTARRTFGFTSDSDYTTDLESPVANITIEIATDNLGANIVASKTYDIIPKATWLRDINFANVVATDTDAISSNVTMTFGATTTGDAYHIVVTEGGVQMLRETWWGGVPGHEPSGLQARYTLSGESADFLAGGIAEGVWFDVTGGQPSESFSVTRAQGIEGAGTTQVDAVFEFRAELDPGTILHSFNFSGTATIV